MRMSFRLLNNPSPLLHISVSSERDTTHPPMSHLSRHTHLPRNHFGALHHRLGHRRTQVIVDVLQLLQQLRQRVRVVRLQHRVGRVQLLHVRVVGVQVHGQRVLRRTRLMRLVRQLVVQPTLLCVSFGGA